MTKKQIRLYRQERAAWHGIAAVGSRRSKNAGISMSGDTCINCGVRLGGNIPAAPIEGALCGAVD